MAGSTDHEPIPSSLDIFDNGSHEPPVQGSEPEFWLYFMPKPSSPDDESHELPVQSRPEPAFAPSQPISCPTSPDPPPSTPPATQQLISFDSGKINRPLKKPDIPPQVPGQPPPTFSVAYVQKWSEYASQCDRIAEMEGFQIHDLTVEVRSTQIQNEKLEEIMQRLEAKIDSLTIEVETLKAENKSLRAEIEALNADKKASGKEQAPRT